MKSTNVKKIDLQQANQLPAREALQAITYFDAFPFVLSDLVAVFATLAFFVGGASCNVCMLAVR